GPEWEPGCGRVCRARGERQHDRRDGKDSSRHWSPPLLPAVASCASAFSTRQLCRRFQKRVCLRCPWAGPSGRTAALFRAVTTGGNCGRGIRRKESLMPNKRANVKNEKQYEALKDKGMSKERAARIANSPGSSSRGGKKSHSSSSRSSSSQGGTT